MAADELLPADELLALGELDGSVVDSLDGSGGAAEEVALLLGVVAEPLDAVAGVAELVDVW